MLEIPRLSSFYLILVNDDLQKNEMNISQDSEELKNIIFAVQVY